MALTEMPAIPRLDLALLELPDSHPAPELVSRESEMMFGIVVAVRVERHDEAGEMLESMVVPLVTASPGFVRG